MILEILAIYGAISLIGKILKMLCISKVWID